MRRIKGWDRIKLSCSIGYRGGLLILKKPLIPWGRDKIIPLPLLVGLGNMTKTRILPSLGCILACIISLHIKLLYSIGNYNPGRLQIYDWIMTYHTDSYPTLSSRCPILLIIRTSDSKEINQISSFEKK